MAPAPWQSRPAPYRHAKWRCGSCGCARNLGWMWQCKHCKAQWSGSTCSEVDPERRPAQDGAGTRLHDAGNSR
eukprot:5492541-Pyramimonas_sp.AAC.1